MGRSRSIIFFAFTCAALLLSLVLLIGFFLRSAKKDPHEGQVYLYDGYDWIWMTPVEGVPVNTLTAEKFASSGRVRYLGDEYEVLRGIDVSEHQMAIDWAQAARELDFACIRLGRRGYTEGGLFEDQWFHKNMQGASENGLMTGVYFFSQAVNAAEALEEARFVLERIGSYRITAPVVYDWEKVADEGARTAEISVQTRTDCAVAFCETIRRAGYTPCVYFNRTLGYYGYDLTRLTDYLFWFSLPESPFPNFYYACDLWQYSFTESVPGVEGLTDMNLWFRLRPRASDAANGKGNT